MNRSPSHHRSSWQIYADLYMLIVAIFAIIISMLLLSVAATPKVKAEKPAAEFLINLKWDDARDVDLDLWMRDQDGGIIYYNNRETPNISLDRDSRGFVSNKSTLSEVKVVISPNHEVIAIRAVMPGDYLVAVAYYAGEGEIDADINVMKVNPNVIEVASRRIHLFRIGNTMNVIAFHVAVDGTATVVPVPPGDLISEGTR